VLLGGGVLFAAAALVGSSTALRIRTRS